MVEKVQELVEDVIILINVKTKSIQGQNCCQGNQKSHKKIVQKIYPEKKIRIQILWLENGQLMEIA